MPKKKVRYIVNKSGCWVWQLCKKASGYGQFKINGEKVVIAHRYYYEQVFGKVSPGLVLDHLCGNKSCVNPEHLEAVTHQENIKRYWAIKKLPQE